MPNTKKYEAIIDKIEKTLKEHTDTATQDKLKSVLPDLELIETKRKNNEKLTLEDLKTVLIIFRHVILPEIEKEMYQKINILKERAANLNG